MKEQNEKRERLNINNVVFLNNQSRNRCWGGGRLRDLASRGSWPRVDIFIRMRTLNGVLAPLSPCTDLLSPDEEQKGHGDQHGCNTAKYGGTPVDPDVMIQGQNK